MNPQLQNAVQVIKNAGNPQAMLQSMISAKNPQIAEIIQLVNSMGGDPKATFYRLAAQRGVDPNSILGMLK